LSAATIGTATWRGTRSGFFASASAANRPLEETTIDGFRVVPIRSRVQLKAEAIEMKNCLGGYEPHCRSGAMAIFSIRGADGKPVADMAAVKRSIGGEIQWRLNQVAGKKNAPAPAEIQAVATKVMFTLAARESPQQ
jgi:hypothetical protein